MRSPVAVFHTKIWPFWSPPAMTRLFLVTATEVMAVFPVPFRVVK